MEEKKESSPQLKYYPVDLVRTYVKNFCRYGLFGLKVSSNYYGGHDFIIRSRFLLTTVTDEHMKDLFAVGKQQIDSKWYGWGYQPEALVAACWVAGLLKKRYFLPQIKEVILTANDNIFFSPAWLSALFLYDDADIIPTIKEYIDKYISPDKHYSYHTAYLQAIYCLELWDEQHQTNHAKAYQQYATDINKKHKKYIRQLLIVSKLIRANITFSESMELQTQLKTLLDETTTPEEFFDGLLMPPTIRSYSQGLQEQPSYEIRRAFLKKNYPQNMPLTLKEFPDQWQWEILKPILFSRKTYQFENATRHYIQNPNQRAYAPEIKKAALLAHDPVDILAAIEIDITYQLPVSVIEICYEKLFQLLPHSVFLYESYALALLMRGNTTDKKAKELYNKAQKIKAKYEWNTSVDDWWDLPHVMWK